MGWTGGGRRVEAAADTVAENWCGMSINDLVDLEAHHGTCGTGSGGFWESWRVELRSGSGTLMTMVWCPLDGGISNKGMNRTNGTNGTESLVSLGRGQSQTDMTEHGQNTDRTQRGRAAAEDGRWKDPILHRPNEFAQAAKILMDSSKNGHGFRE